MILNNIIYIYQIYIYMILNNNNPNLNEFNII